MSEIDYTERYLNFCRSHSGSGEGCHHIILRADGGLDEDSNKVHLSIEDHKRAHEILWEDNRGNILAARAYTVSRNLGNMKGWSPSESWRKKQSEAKRGNQNARGNRFTLSAKARMKISESNRRREISEETRRKISESNSLLEFRKTCSVCGKEFISRGHRAKYCSDSCRKERFRNVQ